MEKPKPNMLIVAGPNGAGKTTLALSYAKEFNSKYIGADKIANQIKPSDPYSARIQAGKKF